MLTNFLATTKINICAALEEFIDLATTTTTTRPLMAIMKISNMIIMLAADGATAVWESGIGNPKMKSPQSLELRD